MPVVSFIFKGGRRAGVGAVRQKAERRSLESTRTSTRTLLVLPRNMWPELSVQMSLVCKIMTFIRLQ